MRSAIGCAISRLIIVAGVVANPQHRRHAPMHRTVGECLRTPNNSEIGSDAGEVASYLGRGSRLGSSPSLPLIYGGRGLSLH
jgi:hypothetical protein